MHAHTRQYETTIRKLNKQKDHRALLKAKYCPRVDAALCTQKNTVKTKMTLSFDL